MLAEGQRIVAHIHASQLNLSYDSKEPMDSAKQSRTSPDDAPQRGFILRVLYRVYANYLGVTPPTPAQERITAVVLIGGTIVGLIAIVVLVLFLWQVMMKMGAQ